MTLKSFVHGSAKSKRVTVPAPWKYTSGAPRPAVRTTVSTPLIESVRRSNFIMLGSSVGAVVAFFPRGATVHSFAKTHQPLGTVAAERSDREHGKDRRAR